MKIAENQEKSGRLDRFDRQIIDILMIDGRISVSDLAARIGLSKTPCAARLRKLMDMRVITGFRALVDHKVLGRSHIAFTEVRLTDTREAALRAFNAAVREVPEIEQCYMIAGQFDYLLKIRTRDIATYRATLGEKISTLPGVAGTSTYVAMEAVKE